MNTLNEQIKAVAEYANLTPRAAELLKRFFLKVTTDAENQELDDWINESPANDQFFDYLLDLNKDGTGAAYMYLLKTYTKKPKFKLKLTFLEWVVAIGVALYSCLLYTSPSPRD